MKKIAIVVYDNSSNFEAIVNYLNLKTNKVDIICISYLSDSKALEKAKELNIQTLYLPQSAFVEYFSKNKFDLCILSDYYCKIPENLLEINKFISAYPSLLPAFFCENPIQAAFDYKVKVTGVSIYYLSTELNKFNIIAQYPVFVDFLMNLDDLEHSINNVTKKLYPIVIESILNEQVFDFAEVMNQSYKTKGCCSNASCCG